MSKYDLEFKLSVVRHYQLGVDGRRLTAKRFGINDSMVRKWVLAYEHHGLEGLTDNSVSYTPEFKESVVRHKHKHHLSPREVAARFKIPSFSTVLVWERRYHKGGVQSLTNKPGRKKNMSKPPRPPASKPLEKMSKEEMLAELEHLRMENAYLKKLKALIQQEKESAPEPKHDSFVN